jgi:hypothetical protein
VGLVAGKFVTKGLNVTSTSAGASAQVIYTCPPRFNANVNFFHVASHTNNNQGITVEWYHVETTTYHKLLNAFVMANNSSHEVGGAGAHIALHPGDKIVCSTTSAGNFDVIISVEEKIRTQT